MKVEVLSSLSRLLHSENPRKDFNALKLHEHGLTRSLLTFLQEDLQVIVKKLRNI